MQGMTTSLLARLRPFPARKEALGKYGKIWQAVFLLWRLLRNEDLLRSAEIPRALPARKNRAHRSAATPPGNFDFPYLTGAENFPLDLATKSIGKRLYDNKIIKAAGNHVNPKIVRHAQGATSRARARPLSIRPGKILPCPSLLKKPCRNSAASSPTDGR
jgi:hypothetical protein